jgi:hypothetical protein
VGLKSGDFKHRDGNIIITGTTDCNPVSSANECLPPTDDSFPYCPPSVSSLEFDQSVNNGESEAYVAVFSSERELTYATYLGGDKVDNPHDAVFDNNNYLLYMVGNTNSVSNFPVSDPGGTAYVQGDLAGSRDGFIAQLCFSQNTVDTRELLAGNSLQVFPNPTNSTVTLLLPASYLASAQQSIPLQIFNAIGQRVNAGTKLLPTDNAIELNLSHLPSGVYFYQIDTYTGQLIKTD